MEGIAEFSIARLPKIVFGEGALKSVPGRARSFGARALVVTGASSFRASPHWRQLTGGLNSEGMSFECLAVGGEPSPELIDKAVAEFKSADIQVVVGVGGGSALDAAKAVAGLLKTGNPVIDHLEGVGRNVPYEGPAVPFIAVPTTAGTGSEATKNAVISRHGPDGFKKSFRDEALIARIAVVDPRLLESCPRGVLAANGMDAFTQLLESLVSIKSNPISEALAWSGLEAFCGGFFAAWEGRSEKARAGRSRLAYASLMSGVVLAQTGLGAVHGLAPPLGSLFPIAHGAACAAVLAEATEVNIRALKKRLPDSPALDNYARVGRLVSGVRGDAHRNLVDTLRAWTEKLALPRLGEFGVGEADVARIVAGCRGSSMKTNPVELTDSEVAEIVRRRL